MFILQDDNSYEYVPGKAEKVQQTLENKLYNVKLERSMFGNTKITFKENNIYDKGIISEAGVFKETKDYILDYFSEEGYAVREAMQLPTRMGTLFTGEPGTGKTFLAGQIAKILRKNKDAIAITTSEPSELPLTEVVDMLREGNPNRLVIMIWDEFEKDYENSGRRGLNKLLTFLDGVDSKDNLLVMATCNSIEAFPDTLLIRKGRFERVVEFTITDEVIKENLITNLIPEKYKEILTKEQVIEATKDIEDINIDTIKSMVRDALINILLKKEPFPKENNKATIPKKKESEVISINKELSVEDIADKIGPLPYDDVISIKQLLEN